MLKECRIRAGFTQAELAARLGVDRTSITKWETGGANPRSGKLLEIASTLGCTVEELLKTDSVSAYEQSETE